MSGNIRHIVAMVVLIALCGVGYILLQRFSGESALVRADDVRMRTDELTNGIISDIEKVSSLTFDMSVFSSPEYISLQEYVIPLTSAPPPRKNPFDSL